MFAAGSVGRTAAPQGTGAGAGVRPGACGTGLAIETTCPWSLPGAPAVSRLARSVTNASWECLLTVHQSTTNYRSLILTRKLLQTVSSVISKSCDSYCITVELFMLLNLSISLWRVVLSS